MKKITRQIMVIFFVSIIIYLLIPKSTKKANPYLSISYTTYDNKIDPRSGMTTNIILYDIKDGKLKKIDRIDYTSQYPLGVYSRKDNKIYYSAYNEKTRGDDLFSFDLKTKKAEQLTDSLFAINEIVPRQNDIVMVAVKLNTRVLRLVTYNKSTKKISYENLQDDDTETWSVGVNINNNKVLYTSTYSQNESYMNAEMESTGEADKFYYADNTVYKYNESIENKEKIMIFEKQKVDAISATDKYLLLTVLSELSDPTKDKILKIDLDTKKQEEIKVEDYRVRRTALSPDNKTIFFIGYPIGNDKKRGIYQYDMESKKVKEIFIQDDGIGFINNFTLLNN